MSARRTGSTRLAIASGILMTLCGVVHAEVGVVYDLNAGPEPYGPYNLSIIDDPDPIPNSWRRLSPLTSVRHVLNADGESNGDGRPSILRTGVSGLPLVSWSKNSPEGFDVVLSAFVEGAWTEPLVLAGSADDELDPWLVLDPADGTVHLLYWIHDGSPRVMHRQSLADLSEWSSPLQVSPYGEVAARPSGTFHQGELVVVYESHGTVFGATPRHVVLATPDGGGFTSEVLTVTQFADPNWPEVHSVGGTLWVDWVDDSGTMSWIRSTTPGVWEPIRLEPFATVEERDFRVRGTIKGQALE